MNKKQSQSGSAHLIIIMILCVALIGALGFVYWQNFMQPKVSDKNVVATKTADNTTTTTPAVTNEGYLVLDNWNVKFKLPADLGDSAVTYQKITDGSGVYYDISTERVSALGGDCARLIRLIRSKESFGSSIGAPILAGQVGDYYYGFHGPQSACSELDNGATHTNIVYPDFTMLKTLLMTVEKK